LLPQAQNPENLVSNRVGGGRMRHPLQSCPAIACRVIVIGSLGSPNDEARKVQTSSGNDELAPLLSEAIFERAAGDTSAVRPLAMAVQLIAER
jgi:hypothetical protein